MCGSFFFFFLALVKPFRRYIETLWGRVDFLHIPFDKGWDAHNKFRYFNSLYSTSMAGSSNLPSYRDPGFQRKYLKRRQQPVTCYKKIFEYLVFTFLGTNSTISTFFPLPSASCLYPLLTRDELFFGHLVCGI